MKNPRLMIYDDVTLRFNCKRFSWFKRFCRNASSLKLRQLLSDFCREEKKIVGSLACQVQRLVNFLQGCWGFGFMFMLLKLLLLEQWRRFCIKLPCGFKVWSKISWEWNWCARLAIFLCFNRFVCLVWKEWNKSDLIWFAHKSQKVFLNKMT